MADGWREDAACAGTPDVWWFPKDRKDATRLSTPRHLAPEAQALCNTCPVKAPCLAYGMTQQWGSYGGLHQDQIRRERHQNRREVA